MSDDKIYQRLGEVAFKAFAKQAYANHVWDECKLLQTVLADSTKATAVEFPYTVEQETIGTLLDAGFTYTGIANSLNAQFARHGVQKEFLKGSVHSYVHYRKYDALLRRKKAATDEHELEGMSYLAGINAKEFMTDLVERHGVKPVFKTGVEYFGSEYLGTSRGHALDHIMRHPTCFRDIATLEGIFLRDVTGIAVRDISKEMHIPFCSIYIVINEAFPERKKPQPSRTLNKKQRDYIAANTQMSAAQLSRKLHIPSGRISKYAEKNWIKLYKPELPDPVKMSEIFRNAGVVNGRVITK